MESSPDQAPVNEFPMRKWSVEVYLLSDKGEPVKASIFDKVTYELHESFGKRARQSKYWLILGSLTFFFSFFFFLFFYIYCPA